MSVVGWGVRGHREHGFHVWTAGDGPRVLALAGPPMSALVYRHLGQPLARHGLSLVAPELFHPPVRPATVDALVARLRPLAAGARVVVGHGLAVPLAVNLAALTGRDLVVCDGPLERLNPLSRAAAVLARRAPALARAAMSPPVFRTVLASSVALRRAVVNPYVMDRDIVAMLGAPLNATPAHRAATAEYIGSLYNIEWLCGSVEGHVALLWASGDLLHPAPAHPASLFARAASVTARRLDGGSLLHVEERPWELAETIHRLASEATAT